MKTENRKSISDDLKKYDFLAKDDDFITVTEWTNEEGVDITINDRIYSFSHGELGAIWYLVKSLDYVS